MSLTTQYSTIIAQNPRSLRQFARHAALTALSLRERYFTGDATSGKPRVQFLYFHHIFDDELEPFDRLLAELAKQHVFISHTEAVERVLTGQNDAPCIAFSSDDGFKNNLQAAGILNRYGAKACFFINPTTIGQRKSALIEKFCSERLEMPPIEFLDWADIDVLINQGHEIGSHTMAHINVAETSLAEFEDDLSESRDILTRRCGQAAHFAYPYGRVHHFSREAMGAVFQAGFQSCASAERGCYSCAEPIPRDKLLLRRDHIVAGWPLSHNMYFIGRNARSLRYRSDSWSNVLAEWESADGSRHA